MMREEIVAVTPEERVVELDRKVRKLEVELDNVIHFSVAQRVTCALKRLIPEGATKCEMDITKGVLALRIGIEAETLSRMIKVIPKLGVRLDGYNVMVTDREKSRRAVCNECAARDWCKSY